MRKDRLGINELERIERGGKYIQFISICILLFSFIACGKKEMIEERVSIVKILEIKETTYEENRIFNGVIVPEKETILSFKTSGKIEGFRVVKGDFVKKGDILAELNRDDYNLNVEMYTKKLQGARENYNASLAVGENAKLQFYRIEKLYEEKATTKKIYDEVYSKYRTAIASERGAKSLMEEAEKGVENSKNRLEDSFLKAPYDGYVGGRVTEEGAVVNAGIPAISLTSKDKPQVNIAVSENEISLFQSGEKISDVSIKFIYQEREYALKVKEIGKKPNFSNFSYPVTLEFLEPVEFLNGVQGKVVVKSKTGIISENVGGKSHQIKIPLSSIFENNGTKVWIFENGRAVSREIEIDKMKENGQVTIKKGLNLGEKIVTAGINSLQEGEKIKPIEEATKSNVGNIL